MREKLATIVGGWAKAGFFSEIMGDIFVQTIFDRLILLE